MDGVLDLLITLVLRELNHSLFGAALQPTEVLGRYAAHASWFLTGLGCGFALQGLLFWITPRARGGRNG